MSEKESNKPNSSNPVNANELQYIISYSIKF